MERVKVVEFENQRNKIVDESILFFSRVSLSKFWKLSTFRGYKGIYSRVRDKCEKTFFNKIRCSLNSLATRLSHKFESQGNFQSDCPFCPIVLQLS